MKENEGASLGAIGKLMGQKWKKVSSSDRAPFETKAASQKKTYHAKMEKYQKSANYRKFQMTMLAWKIHETKKPYPRDPNAPKRSTSAYMLYAASVRSKIVEENPDIAVTEVMREQSVWWKSLSEGETQKWKVKAAVGKKKCDAQAARYMKTADYQNHVQAREAYKKEMLVKRNKLMGIKKRARTPTKAKGEPKSPSKKKRTKRRCLRSRTPKASKSRSVSRRRRSAESPKDPKKRSRKRRAVKRRSKAPKGSKRSTSRSTSRRRARTPKAPKRRSAANKEKTPTRKAAKRRSRTPKASRSRP